jgi:hypothetical protein
MNGRTKESWLLPDVYEAVGVNVNVDLPKQ